MSLVRISVIEGNHPTKKVLKAIDPSQPKTTLSN